jgi:hypothetical protein
MRPQEGRVREPLGCEPRAPSVDTGDRQALTTTLGEPLRAWDAKDQFQGHPDLPGAQTPPLEATAKNDWTSIAKQAIIAAMATAAASLLETAIYASSSTHEALGRVLTAISPDGFEIE